MDEVFSVVIKQKLFNQPVEVRVRAIRTIDIVLENSSTFYNLKIDIVQQWSTAALRLLDYKIDIVPQRSTVVL